MIVWINGAFGAGKTQVAYELRRRLGVGWVADPEVVGYGLHRTLVASSATLRKRLRRRGGRDA